MSVLSSKKAFDSASGIPYFEKLNESVFLREDSVGFGETHDIHRPKLVLLLSWAGADLKNVQKYTTKYQEIFPGVPLLLVLTEFRHILTHSPTSQDILLGPVISVLQSHLASRRTPEPQLLVHVFSNGGSYKLIEIAKRYQATTGLRVPIDTIVFDSAPGVSSLRRSSLALSYALPKLWWLRLSGQVLIWIALLILRSIESLLGKEGPMMAMRRRTNDASLFDKMSKRCYIYSPEDELVGWKDVECHARTARQNGFDAHEELFHGSQHVAHARLDPHRYWNIIRQQWQRDRREVPQVR